MLSNIREIFRRHEEHRLSIQRSYDKIHHDLRELTLKVELVEQAQEHSKVNIQILLVYEKN